MTLQFRPDAGPKDRSKYARQFEALHDPDNWHQWVVLDTVRGGGLYDRLRHDRYVGLRDLVFLVETHRVGDDAKEVCIQVTGRRKKER